VLSISRRRWGYVVWAVALGFVFIPEILAAVPLTESQLPFPTISRMTGHLEYEHAEWEIAPTLLIVVALYSLWRVPPHRPSVRRTPGGRLTFTQRTSDPSFDDGTLHGVWFAVRVVAAALIVTGITLWAYHHWPNQYVTNSDGTRSKLPNFHVAYFLYGSIGLFWLAIPTAWSLARGKDAEFPTLFRTVANLEAWIGKHGALGRAIAWTISVLLIWGMVFLLLHLTLYPFPNITHVLNHSG
jgi:hypothetical protein